MLTQMNKAIAEFFGFVDSELYYTESGSPNGGVFQDGGLFVRKLLEDWGLIESLR